MNRVGLYIAQMRIFLEKRSKREVALIAVTGMVIIYILVRAILLSNLLKNIEVNQKLITAKDQQLQVILTESAKLQLAMEQHSQDHILNEIQAKKEVLSNLSEAKQTFSQNFVSAKKTNQLLALLYTPSEELQLKQIHNLPSVPWSENAKQGDEPLFFKHGLVIDLVGTKEALLAYIESLENLNFHLLFESLQLREQQQQKYHATLTIYTVSEEQDWLQL